jgi:hypothetical protein
VNLPATLTTIGGGAFVGCGNLTSIIVNPGNPAYTANGSMLLNKNGDTLIAYPSASGTVTLVSTVTIIGDDAFSGCYGLQTVNAPEAKTIGDDAFSGCFQLDTLSLPKAQTIGGWAFYGCSMLETLSLPEAQTIGYGAFSGCSALQTLSLPAAQTIGIYAFSHCSSLQELSLPEAKTIGSWAFSYTGTGGLTLTLGSPAPHVGVDLFEYVNGAKAVTVSFPAGAAGYGSTPFDNSDVETNNWGNAFRGKGWDESGYLWGTVNSNISLTFAEGSE